MKQSKLPSLNSPRFVVECMDTKKKLIEIGEKNNETLKDIIVRLVEVEHRKHLGGKTK